jgi:hypothetical protein
VARSVGLTLGTAAEKAAEVAEGLAVISKAAQKHAIRAAGKAQKQINAAVSELVTPSRKPAKKSGARKRQPRKRQPPR